MRSERQALLLDTHIWIWLNEGLPELSGPMRQRIDDAARRGEVWVSIISVWEVSLLYSKQRLRVGTSCFDWVQRALAPPIALAALTPAIAVECNGLPGRFHADPADRIITATARRGPHARHPRPSDPRLCRARLRRRAGVLSGTKGAARDSGLASGAGLR